MHNHLLNQLSILSSIDQTPQPSYFCSSGREEPRPLLVALHPWDFSFEAGDSMNGWKFEATRRHWHYLQPDFRGPNWTSTACASELAQQDILDAVDYVIKHHAIDQQQIYLAGFCGGGHMALMMAANHPHRWAGVSAWSPITDLTAWYEESKMTFQRYWKDLEQICGGPPNTDEKIDQQYYQRSPINHLHQAGLLPLEIYAGISDGQGGVPNHHAIGAYNVIAKSLGQDALSLYEMDQIGKGTPPGESPEQDPTFSRAIYLRRQAGQARLTIFQGRNESIPTLACDFFERIGTK